MLDKLSLRLAHAFADGDLDLGLTLSQYLFDLRDSEPIAALLIDHVGALRVAPDHGSPLANFFRSVDQALANAYDALEPLRFGNFECGVQMRCVSHFRAMRCPLLQDIAFSRVETGPWGLDHFHKLEEIVGPPNSFDFVRKMASDSASWKGLRSDFIAVLGLFLSGRIDNPFLRIDQERLEAVVWTLNTRHERGLTELTERNAEILRLCRQAYRKESDNDFSNVIIDNKLDRGVFLRAMPHLQDQVFVIDLGL